MSHFNIKEFIYITFIVSIWVHISEVFRYFVIVIPEIQFHLSVIDGVAEMNIPIFFIWGVWDTLLSALFVFLFWLCANAFGNTYKSILISGVMSWCFFFVLFWVGMANMNLSNWRFLFTVLPLALIESIVAAIIASVFFRHKRAL